MKGGVPTLLLMAISGAPDLVQSGHAMRGWLDGLGQGMRLADHSGLSDVSRISPYAMTRVLAGPGRDLLAQFGPAPCVTTLSAQPLAQQRPRHSEPGGTYREVAPWAARLGHARMSCPPHVGVSAQTLHSRLRPGS